MSTSPDHLVQTLSWWLTGRADDEQLEQALADPGELGAEAAELVDELRRELSSRDSTRQQLQPLVRETIEAIAHGH
jgi:hypothetical protein